VMVCRPGLAHQRLPGQCRRPAVRRRCGCPRRTATTTTRAEDARSRDRGDRLHEMLAETVQDKAARARVLIGARQSTTLVSASPAAGLAGGDPCAQAGRAFDRARGS
jgi:hypothetical protein